MISRDQILRLSRLGAHDRAWEAFRGGGWEARGDAEARLLKARLLKDKAVRATGDARRRLFLEAADEYAAATRDASTYALINAASLALLGGEPALAERRARAVLAMLEAGDHDPDTPYWLDATRAEALLLLGQVPAAERLLRTAVAAAPRAWEDHAVTLRQFALLLDRLGEDASWLDACRPRSVLHFGGIMGVDASDLAAADAVTAAIEAIRPSAGFGALAAGADILIAEALLRSDADLHVVLPCDPASFRAQSVAVVGEGWVPRFERVLEQASSVEVAASPERLSAAAVAFTDQVAMGSTIGKARALATSAVALHVGAEADAGEQDEASRLWAAAGLRTSGIAIKRSSRAAELDSGDGERPNALLASAGANISGPAVTGKVRDRFDIRAFPGLGEAMSAAAALISEGSAAGSLDFRLTRDRLQDRDLAALLAGAEAAAEGTIIATRNAAAAARLHLPGLDADLVGEVQTAFGVEELWCLRFPDERARQ